MNIDLIKIKKYYGENMMHLCRKLFPTLLETDNLLFELLDSSYERSKYLYDDIIKSNNEEHFKNYIYSLIKKEEEKMEVLKDAKDLLEEAGYNLYECNTEEDIQKFKKYYEEEEKLCTFNGGRLECCHVFFAVKKNVDEIKREDFTIPSRQDEYGTSVISIQFSRGRRNILSIKNRYNHAVYNPDATFSNNLENIIKGLTKSFEKNYNLNINQKGKYEFELPGYVKANDGKYYKYNYEIDNVYYCPNNIIIDNFKVIFDYQEKEKYLLIDYFVLDLVNKKIYLYDAFEDSFVDGLQNIKKIDIKKVKYNKVIKFTFEDNSNALIEIDKFNRITKYENFNIKEVGDLFLYDNCELNYLNIPNVEKIGNDFLTCNNNLKNIDFPLVKEIGYNCLSRNEVAKNINLPIVERIGNNFLKNNKKIEDVNLPIIKKIEDGFLEENEIITNINISQAIEIGNSFLKNNKNLLNINVPLAKKIGNNFLSMNEMIEIIKLPIIEKIGDNFLENNKIIANINISQVREIGSSFLKNNENLLYVNLPLVKKIGDDFLANNNKISNVNIPLVEKIGFFFMMSNELVESIDLPEVKEIGHGFFYKNEKIKYLNLPNVENIGNYFLRSNKLLEIIDLPRVRKIGNNFLEFNNRIINCNLILK